MAPLKSSSFSHNAVVCTMYGGGLPVTGSGEGNCVMLQERRLYLPQFCKAMGFEHQRQAKTILDSRRARFHSTYFFNKWDVY